MRACVRTMLLVWCTRVHKFIIADANVMVVKNRRKKNFAHHANNSEVGGGGVNLNSDALKMNILCPFSSISFHVHIAHYTAELYTYVLYTPKTVNESSIYDMLQSTKKPVLR